MRKLTRLLLVSTVAPAVLASSPSVAQQAAADQGGDIIVTANKREERLQDVALSITAISGDRLVRDQVTDIQDLASRVPGFSFQRGGGGGVAGPQQRLIIRGLNTGGQSATVASVVDDVPLSFSSGVTFGADFAADFEPYDMERIEVLKGPQGTLYGANAMGGLVKYVTKAPDLTKFGGGADLGVSQVKGADAGVTARAHVNVPIAEDMAAIRATAYYDYGPGWIDNNLGNRRDVNDERRYGGRISLLLQPSDALSIRATAVLQNLKKGGPDIVQVDSLSNPTAPFTLFDGYNFDTFLPQPSSSKSRLYTLNWAYDLDFATLTSITGYGTLYTDFDVDVPLYFYLPPPFGLSRPNTTVVSASESRLKKFNQEFRLASNGAAAQARSGLEWQIGAYYTRETSANVNSYFTRDVTTGQDVTIPSSPNTAQVFLGATNAKYREYAGYVDLTYYVSPMFDIQGGVRVFHNRQSFTESTGGVLFFPPQFVTSPAFKSSETDWTFSIAPRLHLSEDVMVYARAASGYRPGGPNTLIPPPVAPGEPATPGNSFSSDSTINYEAGLKASLFDGKLIADVAAYYIDWKDIQVSATIPRAQTGYRATLNAGKASSTGFEWNFEVRPTSWLSLGWLGAYMRAKLKEPIPQINGSEGTQLPYVPKWTNTLRFDVDYDIGNDTSLLLGGTYAFIGNQRGSFNFRPALTSLQIPSYSTLALQAGVRTGNVTFQVYGKNLDNTRGVTTYNGSQTIFGIFLPGQVGLIRPREVGLRVSFAH